MPQASQGRRGRGNAGFGADLRRTADAVQALLRAYWRERGSENSPLRDARGEPFGVLRGRIFPIGRDELGQRGEERGLRETIAVDAVEARFAPGLVQISERELFLLVIGNRPPSRVNARRNRLI